MRKTFYDKTGRSPRSVREAFGPYAKPPETPRDFLGDSAVFICVAVLWVVLAILLISGLI